MSPEAIDPERSRFSKKSDVWSYAVVCWEILTDGKTPFEHMGAVDAGNSSVPFFPLMIYSNPQLNSSQEWLL